MRYVPYDHEYKAAGAMSENERMEYFLTRVFETEEVWGLDDQYDWLLREANGETYMPVWPYKKFAADAAIGEWAHCQPEAEALEVFLNGTLPLLIEEGILVEVMPMTGQAGCLVSPQRIKSIIEGMIDAGEYTLDG